MQGTAEKREMLAAKMILWAALAALTAAVAAASEDAAGKLVSAGGYAVGMTESGVTASHKGEAISIGSYLTVYEPGYKGSILSFREGWRRGNMSVSADGRTITLQAKLAKGSLTYSATASPRGVRVTARLAAAQGASVGPVEYAAFQFPSALVEGGTVEVRNAAGETKDRKAIPAVPKRGAMARGGDVLVIKTAARNVVVSSASPVGVYPFDARVERYGKRQGLWAFTSIPLAAGAEAVSVIELTVEPPDPAPVVGTIRIGPGRAAVAVATGPGATDREKLAADELVGYLARISGKRLDRIEVADRSVKPGVIAVGRLASQAGLISSKELDAVARDGFVVKVGRGIAAVCGRRDVGTVYGAYALLKHLGVKFYAPGCEVVPGIKDLVIGECELRAKPFYEFRKMTGNLKLGHTPSDDLGNPREIGEPGSMTHAAAYLLPFDKYSRERPEYFALQKDGKRLHRDPGRRRFDVHLCLSNPDVRRISAERLLALIDKQKDRTFFGVSQGDGFAWCRCEKCKALDAVAGVEMTDRLLDYVNFIARAVAKKYPDKRILTLAYTDATSPPPTRVRPEPNVMVQFCPYPHRTDCQSHDLTCERNRRGLADLKGWIAKCPRNMYIFDYPRGYKIWHEPFGSFYAMKRKLDFYAANGIRGIYYCGVPTNFRDLFVFVQSRLLWEPKADAEALIDEFMAACYGKAAPHVREYFDFMHRQVERRNVHQMCEGANPGLVTAEYAEKALAMFRKAEAAVADDRVSLYRVRVEKSFVLFADLNERNGVNGKLAVGRDAFARRLAEFVRIGRAMKLRSVGRREAGIVSDWLYRVARIRTRRKPWYADPLIGRLIDDPVKTLAAERQLACQKKIPGGWLLGLEGFRGGRGPVEYSYKCPPRRAVWIYGKNTPTPAMWATLELSRVPPGTARLVLIAQDDDKPAAVRIRITVNGKEVFSGANPFKQGGWSASEFDIPAGALRKGVNEVRFATLDDSPARDANWFMLAECKVLFR